jgi:hypothetical protein
MDPAAESFFLLPPDAKRRVHMHVCRSALEVWESYVRQMSNLSYEESVCGTRQMVDVFLPLEAIEAVTSGTPSPDLGERYLEPIVALGDGDLELPSQVEFAFYAIYNLFRKYAEHRADVDDWLIVNQALSAHPEERWKDLLDSGLASAD